MVLQNVPTLPNASPIISVSPSNITSKPVAFYIQALDYDIGLNLLGDLVKTNPTLPQCDAECVFNVQVGLLQSVFKLWLDNMSIDFTDASSNARYYVFTKNWINMDMNIANALVIDGAISAVVNKQLMLTKQDFLRYLAQKLFGTHLGTDLFKNEQGLLNDIGVQAHNAWTTQMNILNKVSATSDTIISVSDPSYNTTSQTYPYLQTDETGKKYLTNMDTTANNITYQLMSIINHTDPGRLASDFKTQTIGTDGLASVPFRAGDALYFYTNLAPAQGQELLTGVPEIPTRKYALKINIISNDATPANPVPLEYSSSLFKKYAEYCLGVLIIKFAIIPVEISNFTTVLPTPTAGKIVNNTNLIPYSILTNYGTIKNRINPLSDYGYAIEMTGTIINSNTNKIYFPSFKNSVFTVVNMSDLTNYLAYPSPDLFTSNQTINNINPISNLVTSFLPPSIFQAQYVFVDKITGIGPTMIRYSNTAGIPTAFANANIQCDIVKSSQIIFDPTQRYIYSSLQNTNYTQCVLLKYDTTVLDPSNNNFPTLVWCITSAGLGNLITPSATNSLIKSSMIVGIYGDIYMFVVVNTITYLVAISSTCTLKWKTVVPTYTMNGYYATNKVTTPDLQLDSKGNIYYMITGSWNTTYNTTSYTIVKYNSSGVLITTSPVINKYRLSEMFYIINDSIYCSSNYQPNKSVLCRLNTTNLNIDASNINITPASSLLSTSDHSQLIVSTATGSASNSVLMFIDPITLLPKQTISYNQLFNMPYPALNGQYSYNVNMVVDNNNNYYFNLYTHNGLATLLIVNINPTNYISKILYTMGISYGYNNQILGILPNGFPTFRELNYVQACILPIKYKYISQLNCNSFGGYDIFTGKYNNCNRRLSIANGPATKNNIIVSTAAQSSNSTAHPISDVDGNIYSIDTSCNLYKYSTSLTLTWKYNYANTQSAILAANFANCSKSITIDINNIVYIADAQGYVYAIDTTTSPPTTKWTYLTDPTNNSPIYTGTTMSEDGLTIYTSSYSGVFFALNSQTGSLKWRYPATGNVGHIVSPPAIEPNTGIISFGTVDIYNWNLTTIQPDTTTTKWNGIMNLPNVNGVALNSTETKMCLATNTGLFYSANTINGENSSWSVPIRTEETTIATKISAVALSADGLLGVTCQSTDSAGTGRLYFFTWNDTTQNYSTLTQITDTTVRNYKSVAISADGTKLIASVYGGRIYFATWDTSTSNFINLTPTLDTISRNFLGLACSADGLRIVYSVDQGGLIYYADWSVSGSNYGTGITNGDNTLINSTTASPRNLVISADKSIIYYTVYNSTPLTGDRSTKLFYMVFGQDIMSSTNLIAAYRGPNYSPAQQLSLIHSNLNGSGLWLNPTGTTLYLSPANNGSVATPSYTKISIPLNTTSTSYDGTLYMVDSVAGQSLGIISNYKAVSNNDNKIMGFISGNIFTLKYRYPRTLPTIGSQITITNIVNSTHLSTINDKITIIGYGSTTVDGMRTYLISQTFTAVTGTTWYPMVLKLGPYYNSPLLNLVGQLVLSPGSILCSFQLTYDYKYLPNSHFYFSNYNNIQEISPIYSSMASFYDGCSTIYYVRTGLYLYAFIYNDLINSATYNSNNYGIDSSNYKPQMLWKYPITLPPSNSNYNTSNIIVDASGIIYLIDGSSNMLALKNNTFTYINNNYSMTVTSTPTFPLAVGNSIGSSSISYSNELPDNNNNNNPKITSFGTGTGGIGTYNLDSNIFLNIPNLGYTLPSILWSVPMNNMSINSSPIIGIDGSIIMSGYKDVNDNYRIIKFTN
jgi:hypothetical protein